MSGSLFSCNTCHNAIRERIDTEEKVVESKRMCIITPDGVGL